MIDKRENIRDETLAELKLKLAHAHLYYYKNLLKYGPNLFEDDGNIILASKDGRNKTKKEGRTLITDTLKYFESRDEPYFYRMCAKLKRVLDAYDERFKIEKPQNF